MIRKLSYDDRVQTAVAWSEAGSRRGTRNSGDRQAYCLIVLMVLQVHRNSRVYKTVSF